jgi:prevent-host-death family protein
MRTVDAHEAKAHFADLLDHVLKGEEIIITHHDRPVARLVPAGRGDKMPAEETLRRLLAFGDGRRLGKGLSIKAMIEEGRR